MKKATQTVSDPDKRLRSVSYFPQTATFLVTFLNGRAYQLPRTAFAAGFGVRSDLTGGGGSGG